MEEKDFIELYRKAVEQGAEKPIDVHLNDSVIDEVWRNVSDELDIDEVWGRISEKLEHDQKKKTVRLIISWSAAAAVLALFGLFLFVNETKVDTISGRILSTLEIVQPNTILISRGADESNSSALVEGKKVGFKELEVNNQLATSAAKISFVKDQPKTDTVSHLTAYRAIQEVQIETKYIDIEDSSLEMIRPLTYSEIAIAYLGISSITESALDHYSPTIPDAIHYFKGRFSIGFTNVIKNTWLINKETIEGLKPKDLKSTSTKFFPDFGMNVKYNISNKWSTEGSVFISSNIGQSYNEYIYGEYSQKEVILRYTTVDLSAKYTYFRPKNFPYLCINSTFGIYFSKLQSARLAINNQKQNISNQYLNLDYGLVIGQEVEINLFSRISLAPGLYFKVGVPNIIKYQSALNSSLSNSRNGSVDFRLAIYYRLYK
jgi:hypothetical protein